MKQYKIVAYSKESEEFEMQIIAHENILFSELHQGIQSALEYDPLQMASFFLSNDSWEKEEEIALIDMEENNNILLMENTKLSDKIKIESQKLLYLYDFFSERVFYMNIESIEDISEPIFTISIEGQIPMQISIDNDAIDSLMQNIDGTAKQSAMDEFEDEFGNDGISFENIDDLEDY